MSNFDPQSFLDASITESLDTKTIPCPVGEFMGIIDKVVPRQWTSKDGATSGIALDVFWLVEDESVKAFVGRDTVTVKQGIMLDTKDGGLDTTKGKNIGLGRLREAVNMNQSGQPFSFAMLAGQAAKVSVSHRIAGEDTFAEVKTVGRL
jgi:hypothetical protein